MAEPQPQPRITIRLSPNQMQVLTELKEALGCPIAILVRAMVLSFITQNEETLNNIVDKYNETGIPYLKYNELDDLMNNEDE